MRQGWRPQRRLPLSRGSQPVHSGHPRSLLPALCRRLREDHRLHLLRRAHDVQSTGTHVDGRLQREVRTALRLLTRCTLSCSLVRHWREDGMGQKPALRSALHALQRRLYENHLRLGNGARHPCHWPSRPGGDSQPYQCGRRLDARREAPHHAWHRQDREWPQYRGLLQGCLLIGQQLGQDLRHVRDVWCYGKHRGGKAL